MPASLEFSGLVSGGKLSDQTAKQVASAIRSFDGKRVTVSVREQKRRRSTQANAYYWGVVIPPLVTMFREAGNMVDADDVHLFLKLRVGKLAQVFVTPDGGVIKSLGSTAKLSVSEFQDYIARIKAWAAEHGVSIPDPNEPLNHEPERQTA